LNSRGRLMSLNLPTVTPRNSEMALFSSARLESADPFRSHVTLTNRSDVAVDRRHLRVMFCPRLLMGREGMIDTA